MKFLPIFKTTKPLVLMKRTVMSPRATLLIKEMVQTNPIFEDCFIKDQMLLTWNIASFSLSIRSYIVGDSTGHGALCSTPSLCAVSHARNLQLYFQLQNFKKRD